jgi:DNA polymerase-1
LQTAYLIDGMAYVFRAYYAMRSMSAPDGTPINAVFGLGMTLQKFLNAHRPPLVACCLDAGAHTHRNELYPLYKANRGAPPPDLVPQFDLCRELVTALGIPVAMCPGFEADDLIATLTDRLRAARHPVVIVSGDKDLAQLVGPGVQIYDLAKDTWWDETSIPARLGVRAGQVLDLLALTGDAVDNIPGVPGVGPKAAVALLSAFANLESIYADLARIESLPLRGARALRQRLERGRDSAFLSYRLASLVREAPCDLAAEDLRYQGAESAVLAAFAERWGLARVAARVPRRALA